MSGVGGPLVNLATLWMLYVTVHQARRVNTLQDQQLKVTERAAAADQYDRTFSQLMSTQRTLLAQIGVNDRTMKGTAHPWRGIDGMLHLLGEATSLQKSRYVELVNNNTSLKSDATFVAYTTARSWQQGVLETRAEGHPTVAKYTHERDAWAAHAPCLQEAGFAACWMDGTIASLNEQAAAYDYQLDTYHRHLAVVCEWIQSLSDQSVRTSYFRQLVAQLSWVELVFIAHESMSSTSRYSRSSTRPIFEQWSLRPRHEVGGVIFDWIKSA